MTRGRPAYDIVVTPEIRKVVNDAKRAAESVALHKKKMGEAAHRRREAITALSEYALPARQIAELLGISEAAVYLAKHRGKETTTKPQP